MRYDALLPEWIALYQQGHSIHAIAARDGVRFQSVYYYLNRAGIAWRGKASVRKHPVRAAAFDDLADEQAAYWLGLLYADGNLSHNSISLMLHVDDRSHLCALQDFLGTTTPILTRAEKSAAVLAVTHQALAARLRSVGLVERKSLVARYPDLLPDASARHFARGVFDGDGSIYSALGKRYRTPQFRLSLVGAKHLLAGINHAMAQELGIAEVRLSPNGSVWRFMHSGRLKLLRIRDWFYRDATIYLPRKHAVFTLLA